MHVKLTSSNAILLLPNELLCACKPHTVQTAQCMLSRLVPAAPLVLRSLLSRLLLFSYCYFHRLGCTTGQDRHHFCLPGMETSPAMLLNPRVPFRKWLSHFGLHKSSLEALSCGDVAPRALPGFLVVWAQGVGTSVERYQYSTLQKLYLAHFRD